MGRSPIAAKAPTTASAAGPAPHSWDIEHWPPHVYPHTPNRGRYIVRAHRDELMLSGAITRVGREIVVFGRQYERWLQKKSSLVPNYQIAPNR